jgi:hypothetical protein
MIDKDVNTNTLREDEDHGYHGWKAMQRRKVKKSGVCFRK